MPCSTAPLAGRLGALLLLPMLLLPGPPAAAQSRAALQARVAEVARAARAVRATRAASVASRQARTDALAPPENASVGIGIAPTAPGTVPLPFSADLLLPFLWNSDPEQAAGGTPSPELTPEARLTWSRKLETWPLRLSALVDASTDRFSRAQDADTDLLYGRLRAQVESGTDDQEWQPFASYVPTYSFAPTYRRRVDTWHDFALGAAKTWEWDGALRRVPPAEDTGAAAIWSFAVNGAAQRRERDGGPASSALLLNPSVTWAISARWNASLEVDVTRRWFDRYEGLRRRDWLVTPIVTVEFQPPEGWLPQGSRLGRAIGTPVLDLQLFLTRQASNLPEARFHQWGVGPILRTAWKF